MIGILLIEYKVENKLGSLDLKLLLIIVKVSHESLGQTLQKQNKTHLQTQRIHQQTLRLQHLQRRILRSNENHLRSYFLFHLYPTMGSSQKTMPFMQERHQQPKIISR